MTNWQYFVLGVVFFYFLKMLALAIHYEVVELRQKRFIKLVHVTFPDEKQITFIAMDSSDKRSLAKIERQLRERFNVPEDAPMPHIRFGDGFRN